MSVPTYTSPADEELFSAIGRLTLSWAQIELGLDLTVLILHHNLSGNEIESEMPWSLKRKLKYIRRFFNRLKTHGEAFELIAPVVEALVVEINSASEFRHDLVHGFALECVEGSGEITMARLYRGRKPYERKEFKVSSLQILDQAARAGKLAGRVIKLALGLQKLINMASERQR
jgi:hypothetical protein